MGRTRRERTYASKRISASSYIPKSTPTVAASSKIPGTSCWRNSRVFSGRCGLLSNPTRHDPAWFELHSDHLNFCPLAFGFAGGGNNMTKGELRAAISRGYREMSELTKVKCGGDKCPGVGNRAYRCCDRMHCRMTIDHAYKDWGIRLPSTGHQLPLMGPTGCTALPHLRPWCTLHQCQIQETGSTKDRGWDAKYFRLRNKLIRLEQKLAAM